jgi:hypothetical protein
MTTYRQRGTEQPVKSGAGQDQAGCSRTGQAGSGAPRHHRPPDNPVSVIGGLASPDIQPPTEPDSMSVSSIEADPPIELTDMRCPSGQRHQFLVGGRLITREMPCDRKSCPACGPRLQRQLVAEWAHAMGSDQVFRLVVDDQEVAKLRRRKLMRGQELVHLPLPDGRRAVYTTAAIGNFCDDVLLALTSDVAADPQEKHRRRSKLSGGWAQVVDDAKREREAKREPWEWLGRVSRTLEQVEMVAVDLGILVGRRPDMVITETADPLVRALFLKRIRCKGPWQEWGDAATRAVAA